MEPHQILIADDDVDALRLIGLMLERQGYGILAAATGRQTIEKAIEARPSLIILDVMMPDMDGYEVTAKLRGHPVTESIPILMFTAKTGVADRIAGFQAGADDYLTKPVRPGELTARVEALLARQHQADDAPQRARTVGFLPSKGGLGTSTLTLNTALELARMHKEKSIALVELHEGNGTLALQLGLGSDRGPEIGIPGLLTTPLSSMTRDSVRERMIQHPSGMRALLATVTPAGSGPSLDSDRVHAMLRYLGADFDYLLVDLPSRLDDASRAAIKMCDLIIVTVEPGRIGLTLGRTMLDALESLAIERDSVKVVLIHRAPATSTQNRSMIEQVLHREMIAGIPPAPDIAFMSGENGKPIVEMQPYGLVAQQVRRVVESIVEG